MRIAFFAGPNGFKFLENIIDYFSRKEEVRVFKTSTERILQGSAAQEVFSLMQWSDVSWFEWCEPPLTYASQFPKVCKVIVRLHRYEAYTFLPQMVDWDKIDVLVFVSSYLRKLFEKRFCISPRVKKVVVSNAVSLSELNVDVSNKQSNFKIAYIGGYRPEKNPMLALYCLERLVSLLSGDCRLFFLGGQENLSGYELEIKLYLEHLVKKLILEENIVWESPVEHREMGNWLFDKSFFLSTSVVEGHPVGALEAMACGCKPLLHNFPGSDEFFPEDFLFKTIDELLEKVASPFEPLRYRKFVEENFSFSKQIEKVESIFSAL